MEKSYSINAGRKKQGEKIRVKISLPNNYIKSESSCGCMANKLSNGILQVTYKAKKIPQHLSYQDEIKDKKYVTIFTTTGSYKVTIKSIIYK